MKNENSSLPHGGVRIALSVTGLLMLLGGALALAPQTQPEKTPVYANTLSETAPAQPAGTETQTTAAVTTAAETSKEVTTVTTSPYHYQDIPVDVFRAVDLSPQTETDLDYADWWWSEWEDARYLFLPATADRAHLTIECDDGITLNGTPVVSGEETDLFAETDDFDIAKDGKYCGVLHVVQSTLPVVYMTADIEGKSTFTDDNGEKYTVVEQSFAYLDHHKSRYSGGTTVMLNADGSLVYSGEVEKIEAHGNSSWDYSVKKPYNIKLPSKANLFGMGKAKKWVFLSNYLDPSMLRDTATDMIARNAGAEYVLDSVYVDMYADGMYKGTYQVYEKTQIQKNRVAVTDLEEATEDVNEKDLEEYPQVFKDADGNDTTKDYAPGVYRYFDIPNDPEDITGGYLLQFQIWSRFKGKADSGFVTSRGQAIQIDGPKRASEAQVQYIRSFVQDLEDALYSETGYNDKGKHYSEYINLDSLALGYLLEEISQDGDNTYTSFFLWKESDRTGDGKLHYGPPWDFDLAYDNYRKGVKPESGIQYTIGLGYYEGGKYHPALTAANYPISGYHDPNNTYGDFVEGWGYVAKLFQRAEFREIAAKLYMERFDGYLRQLTDSGQEGGSLLEQTVAPLRTAFDINNLRWHMYDFGSNPRQTADRYKPFGPMNGDSYDASLAYLLNAISTRADFLREEYLSVYRTDCSAALDAALEEYDLTRYDSEGRAALTETVADGKTALESAADLAEVDSVVEETAAAMEAIPRAELSGDFDESMHVDLKDAMALLMHYTKELAGIDDAVNSTQQRNGDVDKNGRADVIDAMHILRYYDAEQSGGTYALPVKQ